MSDRSVPTSNTSSSQASPYRRYIVTTEGLDANGKQVIDRVEVEADSGGSATNAGIAAFSERYIGARFRRLHLEVPCG